MNIEGPQLFYYFSVLLYWVLVLVLDVYLSTFVRYWYWYWYWSLMYWDWYWYCSLMYWYLYWYLEMEDEDDFLGFWHAKQSILNKLVVPALRAPGVPASSSQVERVFSQGVLS